MSTSTSKLQVANIMMIVAGVVMLGTLVVDRFVKPPTVQMKEQARVQNHNKIVHETYDHKDREKQERAYAATKLWSEDAEQIGPLVLNRVNELAKSYGLTTGIFRPQRTVEDDKILRVPMVVTLNGPYPSIVKFVRAMEDPAGKVAVTMVQLGSADGVSDNVTATISLLALKDMNAKTEPASKGSGEPHA